MISFEDYAPTYRQALIDAAKREWPQELTQAAYAIAACRGIVWIVGNGGSGSLASHMATDLQLGGVASQALTDPAALSTYANDFGWSTVFKAQLTWLARPGDIVLVISTSGESKNQHGLRKWIGEGVGLITLTGKGRENTLAQQGDINIVVPSYETGVVQDIQEAYLHAVCYWIMNREGEEKDNG